MFLLSFLSFHYRVYASVQSRKLCRNRQCGCNLCKHRYFRKTVRMNMLHGHYTTESEEVFAIVLNPQKLPLSYGRRWILERWENNQWVRLWTKKPTVFFDDEIIPITPPIYYCFSFPIKYYKTTPGKYRISTSMWNDLEKINLNAEFEIE